MHNMYSLESIHLWESMQSSSIIVTTLILTSMHTKTCGANSNATLLLDLCIL